MLCIITSQRWLETTGNFKFPVVLVNSIIGFSVPTEPDNDAASGRDESCSDTNNNSGNDYAQQFKEWREMIIAATEGRDRAEQEKQVCYLYYDV